MKTMYKRKIKDDPLVFQRITNNDLICQHCTYKFDDTEIYGNTSKCAIYECKPDTVLSGGKCDSLLENHTEECSDENSCIP